MLDRKECLTIASEVKVLVTIAEQSVLGRKWLCNSKTEYWLNWASQDYVVFHSNSKGNQQSTTTEIST